MKVERVEKVMPGKFYPKESSCSYINIRIYFKAQLKLHLQKTYFFKHTQTFIKIDHNLSPKTNL